MAAKKILSCYPDYGKLPPEYVVNLADVLATYSEPTLVALCDLRTGIVSKCKFPPTVADVVDFCDRHEERERFMADAAEVQVAAERARVEREEWWRGREAALVRAREKYPKAFLLPDGTLAQPRIEEYRPSQPVRIERPTGGSLDDDFQPLTENPVGSA